MVAQTRFRLLLLFVAGSLAACQSLPRSVAIETGQPTTLTWIPRKGPELSLRNASSCFAADVYSSGKDPGSKVVADDDLQALLDVFTAEKLFDKSLPAPPGNAREMLRLDMAGRTWIWARRGSFTDPGEEAYRSAVGYFMGLYNKATAYHSAPDALDGNPRFLSAEQLARREAELRRYYAEKRRRQAARGGR